MSHCYSMIATAVFAFVIITVVVVDDGLGVAG